jgi:dihydrolipoamide dehydrogenase
MTSSTTRLLVLGGGPGGYVAAIRAAQLGIQTTLVEGARLGGTCLNVGCIPSKALIHAADEFEKVKRFAEGTGVLGIQVQAPRIDVAQTIRWKDDVVGRLTGGVGALLKKHGVTVVNGWARIVDGKTVHVSTGPESDPAGSPERADITIQCEHLLLACGSEAVALPGLPFGESVISATEALSPSAVPRRLVVVGAGYIGLELGIAYRKLGSSVVVVEALERILPTYDDELTRPVKNALRRLGIEVRLGCSVQGLEGGGSSAGDSPDAASAPQARLRVRDAQGADSVLEADQVLVAVGRRPRTQGWGWSR